MQYLPLFFDLRGRPVLVIGGGAIAARKVALLLEAGAAVTVVAPRLGDALAAAPFAGRFTWLEARFDAAMIGGQRLVIAATGERAVNAAVAVACEAAGLPVNVVDDPALSNTIVPAIIDRSPLMIAVSSAGTAPMLARAVRERLESLVDESFGALARLLAAARQRIVARIPDAATRRRFYGQALAGEVARLVRAGRDAEAGAALEAALQAEGAAEAPRGRVLLVGAGPGDPGLLTLRALRALQEADVVLHDGLVSDGVLALVRRDATRIDVSKEGGGPSVPQSRINALLVEHAHRGQTVVRLKGGDPFVFGRGGEELRVLRGAGIPFEVVPGITAAVGAAAYAGIPLTDRDHAPGVRFVTARRAAGVGADPLAGHGAGTDTLVVYMGRAQLHHSARTLLDGGRAPSTPVALVEDATRATQRILTTTLDALAGDAGAAPHGLSGPVVMIVGEAAGQCHALHWFGRAPERLSPALERAS
jgi:uroporphyrin-III C-methyltransferase / precorrin-2 dehydrogenase / sirohydrochlorin ferrochelatase